MIKELLKCPVCKADLQKAIRTGDRDEIIVICDICGKFVMSAELFEDYLENDQTGFHAQNLKDFLRSHKADKLRPWLTKAPGSCPEGYKNYPHDILHYLNG
jgi:hypothetical protein